MAKERPEELLGQYLATWIDDLREGKGIEISNEDLHKLTQEQAEELIDMAKVRQSSELPDGALGGTIRRHPYPSGKPLVREAKQATCGRARPGNVGGQSWSMYMLIPR